MSAVVGYTDTYELEFWILRMLNFAYEALKYNNSDQVHFKVHGSPDISTGLVERNVYVSNTPPVLETSKATAIWINSDTHLAYKNYPDWKKIEIYEEVFSEASSGNDATWNSGTPSVPVILSRNPIDPKEAVTKEYVDNLIQIISIGENPFLGTPLQNVGQLMAIDTTSMPDKVVRFVEDTNTFYAFDQTSTQNPNGFTCIKPTVGVGRWNALNYVGNIDGGAI